jgi:hypothetical protein
MARLASDKLAALKRAFTEDGISPSQAAQVTGVTYATAKRYYDQWSDEIKRKLESKLLPSLEESVKRARQKRSTRHGG